ncbi:pentatricopeptide repeat-containing protein [Tanacetum coccineum]
MMGTTMGTIRCLDDARRVFNAIPIRNVIGYNAMIEGYSRLNNLYEALDLFREMRLKNIDSSLLTFVSLLGFSASLLTSELSKQIHGFMVKFDASLDIFVGSALVDEYSKCSSPSDARLVFDEMREKDIVVWNAMLFGYTQVAENKTALKLYHELQLSCQRPDKFTFVALITAASNLASLTVGHQFHTQLLKTAVLLACDHMGLVKEGFDQFESMANFGFEPGLEHYACMVSLLGQAGKLYEAKAFIEKLPIPPAAIIWKSLLSACRVAGNLEMGKYEVEKAIHNDPNDSGSYILLSNIYASKGMWGEAKKVRRRMEGNGVVKEAGCSWIEMDNEVHVFVAKDRSHRHAELIYSVINYLTDHFRALVYKPDSCITLINN